MSCAVGLAVLDVIEQEGLQANALEVGTYLLEALRGLMPAHPIIGDVRGAGLFIGIELVRDRETLHPAAAETSYLVNRLREYGILTGTGRHLPQRAENQAAAVFFKRGCGGVRDCAGRAVGG